MLKVYVYYNLHKHVFSIRAMEGPEKGRVIGYSDSVTLQDATPKVSQAGRLRVIAEGRKNVHAGMVGHLVSTDRVEYFSGRAVYYNPYKCEQFMFVDTGLPATKGLYLLQDRRVTQLVEGV